MKKLSVCANVLIITMLLLAACSPAATAVPAAAATAAPAATSAPAAAEAPKETGPAKATAGQAVSMVLLPKFLGILPFDQAHTGALEAEAELKNPTALQFLGPTPENSVAGQIEIITTATTQKVGAIMLSNNAGDTVLWRGSQKLQRGRIL